MLKIEMIIGPECIWRTMLISDSDLSGFLILLTEK